MHDILAYCCFFIVAGTFISYLCVDGKALMSCALIPFTSTTDKQRIFNALLPSWDANQTWLVFTLAMLYGAFAKLFSITLSANYLLMISLLVLYILRGSAIEFYLKSKNKKVFFEKLLATSSFLIMTIQGILLARIILYMQMPLSAVAHISIFTKGLYFIFVTATLMQFHYCRALTLFSVKPTFYSKRFHQLLLIILFYLTWGVHLIITAHYSQHSFTSNIIVFTEIAFVMACCYRWLNYYAVLIAAVVTALFELFPYQLFGHITINQIASTTPALVVIASFSALLIPAISIALWVIRRAFQSSTESLSY